MASEAEYPELDLDDARDTIVESMSADDRQTGKQYRNACTELDKVFAEVTRLRSRVAELEGVKADFVALNERLHDIAENLIGERNAAQMRVAELERVLDGKTGWIACVDELPDSDIWVLAINHEADYVLVQLEFTDDSEGHGEPYWTTDGGDLALCNYPHWHALPAPPPPLPAPLERGE